MAVGPTTVTSLRSTAVDFSVPFYFEPIGILIRVQQPHSSLLSIVSLFDRTVWVMYLLAIFVAAITVYLLERLTKIKSDPTIDTVYDSAWYIYSAHLNQSIKIYKMVLDFFVTVIF